MKSFESFLFPNDWSVHYRGATRFQGDRTPELIFTFDLYTCLVWSKKTTTIRTEIFGWKSILKQIGTHVRSAQPFLISRSAPWKKIKRLSLSLVFNLVLALGNNSRMHTRQSTSSITFFKNLFIYSKRKT